MSHDAPQPARLRVEPDHCELCGRKARTYWYTTLRWGKPVSVRACLNCLPSPYPDGRAA